MELNGERLRLREFRPADLVQTSKWVADPAVARWILPAWPLLPSSWEAWLHRIYTSPDSQHFAIVLRDGRHIGNVSLHTIRWEEGVAEVGIVLGEKDCWGRGYGPEALQLLIRYAFAELGLKRLLLHVHRENARAIRAYHKVGFQEVRRPWPWRALGPGIVAMVLEAKTPVRAEVA